MRSSLLRTPALGCAAACALTVAIVLPATSSATAAPGTAAPPGAAARTPAAALVASRFASHRALDVAARNPVGGPIAARLAKATGFGAAAQATAARVEVTVEGHSTAAVHRALHGTHARVLASAGRGVTAVLDRTSLAAVRHAAGVTSVAAPARAWPVGNAVPATSRSAAVSTVPTAQSVTASGAAAWQQAGWTGAGVKVAVVDAGFGGLAAAERSGELPAGQVVYPRGQDHCRDDAAEVHGTAVAEIVHQTAPGATLYLYCVDDSKGVTQSENQLQAAGVRIVNTSLSFVGDGRDDGTGPAGSVELAVRKARRAGILWVSAAGNSAQDHWAGTLSDRNHDGLADLVGTSDQAETDQVSVDPDSSGDLTLTWNQWPRSSARIALVAVEVARCDDVYCSRVTVVKHPHPVGAVQRSRTAPALQLAVENTSRYQTLWQLVVEVGKGFPHVHYDLTYLGDVGPSTLALRHPQRAAAGSIAEPASSPYALAVAALDVDPAANGGAGACESDSSDAAYPLELFSSRGPTINGKVKPDLAGYDGVSSAVYPEGFCGTSAATPGVVGDAALAAQAFPRASAAGLQAFLVRTANNGRPYSHPNDNVGHGRVTLGTPPALPSS